MSKLASINRHIRAISALVIAGIAMLLLASQAQAQSDVTAQAAPVVQPQQYVDELPEPLTQRFVEQIARSCSGVEEAIKTVSASDVELISLKNSAYESIYKDSDIIVIRIQQSALNADAAEVAVRDLAGEINLLEKAKDSYLAVLQDIDRISCSENPEGYYAAIQSADRLRDTMIDQIESTEEFISGPYRVIIESLKAQFNPGV